ncbi:MAG: type II toxin-antitoxin system PemK/MazF family toxin [Firmicutes bacterium]|nr:type II toxin-antitoxin system PemK/MazF family toxin [Bacillota bacterium]
MDIKRGDIYFANLGDCNVGSEQTGKRPVLVIQNDVGNYFAPTVIVACITSRLYKNKIPTHVFLDKGTYALSDNSLVLCEQIKTLDKQRLETKIATLTDEDMHKVNRALLLSLALQII